MSSGGQYAGMSALVFKHQGSICRNDSVINHTDKTRKNPKLQPNIQCFIKTMEFISASQKQGGQYHRNVGSPCSGMGGQYRPEYTQT